MQASLELPEKLGFLLEPHRYKVTYGGRGGAKSHGIARALLAAGAESPKRVPCCREIQKSISDSVHALLAGIIKAGPFESFYRVTDTYIEGKNGTLFTFHGLKHNVANIKSLEGADICWVEEAQAVTKSSWSVLIPTIRKPNSEIWISFNPELESDDTYQRFVKNPPTGAKVVKIGWQDNPWFPAVLRQEMEDLKARNYDEYLNVWEGECRLTLDGAIYANELRQAIKDGRICRVPYDQAKPVMCVWDLGRADMTAIWFVQMVGFEFRLIDYYEARGHHLTHYIKHLKDKPYAYADQIMPHDADNELLASELTIRQQMKAAGFNVKVIQNKPGAVMEGINAARTIFSRCYFDADKCADGIKALQNYRYEVDPDTGKVSARPLHDWASHGSDAFRYLAIGLRQEQPRKPLKVNTTGII